MEPNELRVILTGAARGIGAATARLLVQGGARVLVTDVLDKEGEALVRELGPNAVYSRLDVADPQSWQTAVDAAHSAFGPVNALFNNAGIVSFGSVVDCTPEDFRRVLAVNLEGVFLGIRAVVPSMRRAGGGMIINVSSTAGLQGYAGLAAYVSSKWAVRGLTKAAALDLARDRIRVVSLHPGPIRTPMTDGLSDEIAAAQPIPRFGEADEVARMARFLFTEATYSTGAEFVVDGGAVTGQVLPLPQS